MPSHLTGHSQLDQRFDVPDRLAQDDFVARAVQAPDRPAIVARGRTLSYGELLCESRALASRLRALGARPNTLIAVVMDKGWEQIVGVLGILESGAAYLPIDPAIPQERLSYLLENGDVSIVLTQSWVEARYEWPAAVRLLKVDELERGGTNPAALPRAQTPRIQTTDDIAYVLYTSGSTGKPKGVMIGHRGLVNCIDETNRTFQVTANDRVLAVTALHHDMSVYDILGILAAGGAIVMPDRDGIRSPDHWLELIAREHVTVWNSVPAFMEMLLVHVAAQDIRMPGHLRLAFLGGDWIPLTAPARIRRHFGDVQVVSVGGPTETTVWNIWYAVGETKQEWSSIPYGHPIAKTRYCVLDENLEECASGTAGEMCCAGIGLFKGYWRNEEQTRARTAIHPRTGERLYRTGDRGRFMADGELEFLGRIDRQVKISGQRIELGEIEAALIRQPGIRQAIVDAVEIEGHKKLVAYVVPEAGMHLEASKLRAALEKSLPAYMVPFSFLTMDALPLNTNGKVDRTLLPAPVAARAEPSNGRAADHAKTGSGTEETISALWRKLLALECVGVDDNFFDLGGDSILLVQAHGELQRLLHRTFPVTDLFQFPTVRALARALEGTERKPAAVAEMAERVRKQRAALARKHTTGSAHE